MLIARGVSVGADALAASLDQTVRVRADGVEVVGRLRFMVSLDAFYVLTAQGNRAGWFSRDEVASGAVIVTLYGAGKGG